MNIQQRRMFRGRGGPTDRRLPKHNARRRKTYPPQETCDHGQEQQLPVVQNLQENSLDGEGQTIPWEGAEDADSNTLVEILQIEESSTTAKKTLMPTATSVAALETNMRGQDVSTQELGQDQDNEHHQEQQSRCALEVKHLLQRVRNVQESIQTSHSIVNPKLYQENVLNAVYNCVNEWRSIATHYSTTLPTTTTSEDDAAAVILSNTSDENNICSDRDDEELPDRRANDSPNPTEEVEEDTDDLTVTLKKQASMAVFQLIQFSLQCGPLAGAKPGYFKRCGSAVAQVVGRFLQDIVPHPELGNEMGFSPRQMEAMESWKRNAEKAIQKDQPPSRTALKQQEGKGTGKKAKTKQR